LFIVITNDILKRWQCYPKASGHQYSSWKKRGRNNEKTWEAFFWKISRGTWKL